jgi:hypothetical protein
MTTKSFIILARRCRVQCAHPLCDRSRQITLAISLHPERPRILRPTYHKLPNLESLLTRPRKRLLHHNTPHLPHMRCMRVGRGITMSRIAAIVNVVSVSCSAGYV